MNGYGDGGAFFKKLLRDITSTNMFLPYSWKGNKRTSENICFSDNHKTFLKFFTKIIMLNDKRMTQDSVHFMFSQYLRYKNVNHARELERIATNKPTRESLSRTRRPRKKIKFALDTTQLAPPEPTPNNPIQNQDQNTLNSNKENTPQNKLVSDNQRGHQETEDEEKGGNNEKSN